MKARPVRCQFCRGTEGEIVHVPAGPGFIPARRGYRAIGEPPHDWHQACHDEREQIEAASRAKAEADSLAEIAEAVADSLAGKPRFEQIARLSRLSNGPLRAAAASLLSIDADVIV